MLDQLGEYSNTGRMEKVVTNLISERVQPLIQPRTYLGAYLPQTRISEWNKSSSMLSRKNNSFKI